MKLGRWLSEGCSLVKLCGWFEVEGEELKPRASPTEGVAERNSRAGVLDVDVLR